MLTLTRAELAELTGKTRSDAQRRVLDYMSLPYRVRPDQTLAVLRSHVVQLQGDTMPAPREPELQP